jgi:hypothetical protein
MDRTSSKQERIVGTSLLALAMLAGVSYATAAMPPSTPTMPPTWPALYRKYLAEDTVGDCASCHAEAATPERAYDWLAQQQYMVGSTPYLIDPRTSCFSWLGGDMPPDGPSSYVRARRDFETWADAGASKD